MKAGWATKVEDTQREALTAVDVAVQQASTLPEYAAYAGATEERMRREEQSISPSHPASEVNAYDSQLMIGKLRQQEEEARKALAERLMQDSPSPDALQQVMGGIDKAVYAAAEQGVRVNK